MLINGDITEELKKYPDNHFDFCIGDPPYGIAFMSKKWDKYEPKEFQAWCEEWGKDFVGIEKEKEYCDIAEKRIKASLKPLCR